MSRRLLDEMALGASGLSALDEAVRSLTATSAIYDLQRTAADLLELNGTTAMQSQLEEAAQKIAPPLPKVVESALSLSKKGFQEQSPENVRLASWRSFHHALFFRENADFARGLHTCKEREPHSPEHQGTGEV